MGRSAAKAKSKATEEQGELPHEGPDPAVDPETAKVDGGSKAFRWVKSQAEKATTAKIYQLPIWPDPQRGIPNELIRSALFSAIQRGTGFISNSEIAAQEGFKIRYTGPRLDQSHLDVFEGVMHIARGLHEGNEVRFSAHRLLTVTGRTTGRTDYVWLHKMLKELTATAVEIVDDRGSRSFWGSLLPRGAHDEQSQEYVVTVNRDLARLFARGFTRVDSEVRAKLRRKPLARWLHLYYSSHAAPYPVSVEWICKTSGSQAKTLKSFRQKLKQALDQIQAAGVISGWTIGDDDLVRVQRVPTPSQLRHLQDRQGEDPAS
jgi:hypothetical protein